jgi:hypothetical protein
MTTVLTILHDTHERGCFPPLRASAGPTYGSLAATALYLSA